MGVTERYIHRTVCYIHMTVQEIEWDIQLIIVLTLSGTDFALSP